MFLDYSSQKSWPVQIIVKAFGGFSPRTSGDTMLGGTATILTLLLNILVLLAPPNVDVTESVAIQIETSLLQLKTILALYYSCTDLLLDRKPLEQI